MTMTKDELQYLRDLKGMDDLGQGMLDPSVSIRNPDAVRDRLLARGLAWTDGEVQPYGKAAVYLTSRGLQALRRIGTS